MKNIDDESKKREKKKIVIKFTSGDEYENKPQRRRKRAETAEGRAKRSGAETAESRTKRSTAEGAENRAKHSGAENAEVRSRHSSAENAEVRAKRSGADAAENRAKHSTAEGAEVRSKRSGADTAESKAKRRQKESDSIYIALTFVVFAAIAAALLVLPRSTVSELEKRKLAEFPQLNAQDYFSGDYTAQLSSYFSDTVPFRDKLMTVSTMLTDKKGVKTGITLHGVTAAVNMDAKEEPKEAAEESTAETTVETTAETTTEFKNQQIESVEFDVNDDKRTVMNNGIAIVDTRALMLYGGIYELGESYAAVLNKYKQTLGEDVNVYSMVIPTACEFYATSEIKPYITSQLDNINHIIECLDDVIAVNVYTTLANHRSENIYLRTDHHWCALGAYYAAKEFAAAAGVGFKDISEYDQKINPGYVGTMYAYSGDITLKNNPEDFVYYVPKNKNYTVTYYDYMLNDDGDIVGTQEPYQDDFFINFPEGSSEAYSTFMGGDGKLVNIHTDTANGRKLAIIKDSYGNALPAFLFNSFEDIYVIDMRYFSYNLPNFVKNKGITDLLFANNAFHAATQSTFDYYEEFLTQADGYVW